MAKESIKRKMVMNIWANGKMISLMDKVFIPCKMEVNMRESGWMEKEMVGVN
jgi:hypothetical protein